VLVSSKIRVSLLENLLFRVLEKKESIIVKEPAVQKKIGLKKLRRKMVKKV
jgi:hypothetical protein